MASLQQDDGTLSFWQSALINISSCIVQWAKGPAPLESVVGFLLHLCRNFLAQAWEGRRQVVVFDGSLFQTMCNKDYSLSLSLSLSLWLTAKTLSIIVIVLSLVITS
jgi:hypothetical protein